MTSKFLMGLVLACCQLVAIAQAVDPVPSTLDAAAERERIAQERASHEATFLQAERDCYSRFAVSDCLRSARKNRRLAMDELRRRELLLNDMDRQTKALEALNRIEANVAAQQQRQLEQAAQPPSSPDEPAKQP